MKSKKAPITVGLQHFVATVTNEELDFLGGEHPLAVRVRFFAWIVRNWPYPEAPFILLAEPLLAIRKHLAKS